LADVRNRRLRMVGEGTRLQGRHCSPSGTSSHIKTGPSLQQAGAGVSEISKDHASGEIARRLMAKRHDVAAAQSRSLEWSVPLITSDTAVGIFTMIHGALVVRGDVDIALQRQDLPRLCRPIDVH